MMIRLTRAQGREIDRRAIEEYHIPGIVLMENAARGAAEAAGRMLAASGGGEVLIVCGGGNNGGDGLAAARHLHNRGLGASVLIAGDARNLKGDAQTNWWIARAMNIPIGPASARSILDHPAGLVIDALLGTGLSAAPRAEAASLIEALNQKGARVLAIDLPSGLDCDSGEPLGACVRAHQTVTFVAEKAGFANPNSRRYTGEVTVADIGCPRELIEEVLLILHHQSKEP